MEEIQITENGTVLRITRLVPWLTQVVVEGSSLVLYYIYWQKILFYLF